MDLKSQKRIASKLLKCGMTRVKVVSDKAVEEALTREDVRGLIRRGLISKAQKRGTGRAVSKKRLVQKKRGRRYERGSRKGKRGALNPSKAAWMRRVRPIRGMLRELRDAGRIRKSDYRKLFLMIKGGAFRNKKHLFHYLKERELLVVKEEPAKKPERKAAKKPAQKKAPPKKAKAKPAKKTKKEKARGKPESKRGGRK